MEAEELIELVSGAGKTDTWKISRRDLGFIGGLVKLQHVPGELTSDDDRA